MNTSWGKFLPQEYDSITFEFTQELILREFKRLYGGSTPKWRKEIGYVHSLEQAMERSIFYTTGRSAVQNIEFLKRMLQTLWRVKQSGDHTLDGFRTHLNGSLGDTKSMRLWWHITEHGHGLFDIASHKEARAFSGRIPLQPKVKEEPVKKVSPAKLATKATKEQQFQALVQEMHQAAERLGGKVVIELPQDTRKKCAVVIHFVKDNVKTLLFEERAWIDHNTAANPKYGHGKFGQAIKSVIKSLYEMERESPRL